MSDETPLEVVRAVFRERDDPTEPLTASEVAVDLDCTRRTAYNKLTELAERDELQTKKVGARGRVWWQATSETRRTADETRQRTETSVASDGGRQADLVDSLFQYSPSAIAVFDPDGSIARANQHIRPLLTTAEEADVTDYAVGAAEVYDSGGELLAPAERPYMRVFDTGEPVVGAEIRVTDATGNPQWLLLNATPLFDADGEVAQVLTTARNITSLKEQEQQFRELAEHVGEIVWIATADASELLYINSAFEDVHGTSCAAAYDDPTAIRENIHPDDQPTVEATLEAMVTDVAAGEVRDVYPYEYRVQHPDGSVRWVEGAAYPVRDETGSTYRFAGITTEVTESRKREHRLASQRDELARVERLNTVIRDVTSTLVGAETRTEIEETICDRLADEPTYTCAWIGSVDGPTESVTLRAWSGFDDCQPDQLFERVSNTVRVNDGPTARAAWMRTPQVVDDVATEPQAPWCRRAHQLGIRSVAAVPLVYNRRLFGVLTLCARWPAAFGPKEETVLEELGRAIGHAISALEWKDMLLSERVVELELESTALAVPFTDATDGRVTLDVDRVVRLRDHTLLQYFTLTGISPEAYFDVLDEMPSTLDARLISRHADSFTIEIHTSEAGLGAVLTRFGGRTVESVVEDGVLRARAELPPSADVRQVVEAIQEVYPDMTLRAQQTTSRPRQTPQAFRTAVESRLTERQASALEMAYYGGYLEWPRDSTGEDLADSMGVAPPTFHKHLRTGQRKLLEVLFDPDTQTSTLDDTN